MPEGPPVRIWRGCGLEAGQWQFVAERRSPDTTEVVKRAHAKSRLPRAPRRVCRSRRGRAGSCCAAVPRSRRGMWSPWANLPERSPRGTPRSRCSWTKPAGSRRTCLSKADWPTRTSQAWWHAARSIPSWSARQAGPIPIPGRDSIPRHSSSGGNGASVGRPARHEGPVHRRLWPCELARGADLRRPRVGLQRSLAGRRRRRELIRFACDGSPAARAELLSWSRPTGAGGRSRPVASPCCGDGGTRAEPNAQHLESRGLGCGTPSASHEPVLWPPLVPRRLGHLRRAEQALDQALEAGHSLLQSAHALAQRP